MRVVYKGFGFVVESLWFAGAVLFQLADIELLLICPMHACKVFQIHVREAIAHVCVSPSYNIAVHMAVQN